jgi:addiction module HigA family antidote|tara:strand:- start:54 stop:362 length:309 start_codon:yes stop_codon:yes gene_type:complete
MKNVNTVNAAAVTLREILEQIPVSQKTIAENTGIPSAHLSGLKNGTRRFTPEYDLRLSRCFKQSEGFWLRLQLRADLRKAKAAQPDIKTQVTPLKKAELAMA